VTIRNYINRRGWIAKGAISIWAAAVVIFCWTRKGQAVGNEVLLCVIGGWIIILAFALIVYWRTFCPRCGSHFRLVTCGIGRTSYQAHHNVRNRCPRCSVSVDEPMESPDNGKWSAPGVSMRSCGSL
jgi:hypothetical protein